MTTYLFPGQGSQHKGMGKTLFEQFPILTQQASDFLGYSIAELCLTDSNNLLNQTQFTQPALYVVNALSFLQKQATGTQRPDYLAGHSLGEYSALFAAGCVDFMTGLRLVQERGRLMSQAKPGSMAAIVGLTAEAVATHLATASDAVTIANFNSYQQIVITGDTTAIQTVEPKLKQAGATVIPLKISGAFHSPAMQAAQAQFEDFLHAAPLALPSIPVIANVNAKPYAIPLLRTTLLTQLTSPVRWYQSMEYLLQQGETTFEEIGPGNVLTGLLRRIQNKT